jgi:hypothetical protein
MGAQPLSHAEDENMDNKSGFQGSAKFCCIDYVLHDRGSQRIWTSCHLEVYSKRDLLTCISFLPVSPSLRGGAAG